MLYDLARALLNPQCDIAQVYIPITHPATRSPTTSDSANSSDSYQVVVAFPVFRSHHERWGAGSVAWRQR
jgi:hypothetical protein